MPKRRRDAILRRMTGAGTTAGPVGEGERVRALDVLRGVALFGVFTVNLVEFARDGVLATEAQVAALATARLDDAVFLLVEWLLGDKANTIFAFLFGLGFSIQLARAEAKGARFERLYLRRLAVLLGFGLIHITFLWAWDILTLYALAGFALFALRRLPTRAVLALGLALACVDPHLVESAIRWAYPGLPSGDFLYGDAETLARQRAILSTDYGAMVAAMARLGWVDYVLNASLAGWLAYALGRHLLGLYAGRRGLIQHADAHRGFFRRILLLCLPTGLVAALLVRLLANGTLVPAGAAPATWETIGTWARAPASALLAAGYVAGIVLALRTRAGAALLLRFAPVGRMALSNYVAQSLVYGLLWSGFGFALAGRIGSAALVAIAVAGFAVQVALSGWWLARCHYGPLEWLWRALTYGTRPAMRRITPPAR